MVEGAGVVQIRYDAAISPPEDEGKIGVVTLQYFFGGKRKLMIFDRTARKFVPALKMPVRGGGSIRVTLNCRAKRRTMGMEPMGFAAAGHGGKMVTSRKGKLEGGGAGFLSHSLGARTKTEAHVASSPFARHGACSTGPAERQIR